MRAPLPLVALVLLAGCSQTTSPTTDPPVAAVTRTVTTDTVQHQVPNPCTGEGMVLTVVETFTFQGSNATSRYAYILRTTGVGELGTTYAGQVQQTDVFHPAGEAEHLTLILRGSDGSRFSVVALFVSAAGTPRVELTEFRCL